MSAWRCTDRDLWVDLPAVARGLLSAGPPAEAGARVRREPAEQRRDQRLVLLVAMAVELPELVRADAGRLRVLGEGRSVHHPHEEARGRRDPAGQFLRLWRAGARAQARAAAVAAAADAGLRSRPAGGASSTSCRGRRPRPRDSPSVTTSGSSTGQSPPTSVDRPLRHALEIRHGSYDTPGFVELLREHDVGLVVADTAGKWPMLEDVTSRLRVRAPARLGGALRQRLRRSGTRLVGCPDTHVGRRHVP